MKSIEGQYMHVKNSVYCQLLAYLLIILSAQAFAADYRCLLALSRAPDKVFGLKVYSLQDWQKIPESSPLLIGHPVLITYPEGVVLQTTLTGEHFSRPVVEYAKKLLEKSRQLYQMDSEQVERDKSHLRTGLEWDFGDMEFQTDSYEVNGAIIDLGHGEFRESDMFTSNQKNGLYDTDGGGPHRSLVGSISNHLTENEIKQNSQPTLYVFHTHPRYSPLSVPDIMYGNHYIAQELKSRYGDKVQMHFFAISDSRERIKVEKVHGEYQLVQLPDVVYFMHDHTNSKPSYFEFEKPK